MDISVFGCKGKEERKKEKMEGRKERRKERRKGNRKLDRWDSPPQKTSIHKPSVPDKARKYVFFCSQSTQRELQVHHLQQ